MTLTVVSGQGHRWQLAERIGSGSEGMVYAVGEAGLLVAKLVPDPPDRIAYRRRIARLVRQRREPRTVRLLAGEPVRLAWPMLPVRTVREGVDGYVMPDMRRAFQPFTHLLAPAARSSRLPRATWATALAAAWALARLLAELHAEGYVVGDLKPDNLWVDERGRVGMADVDSWQFQDGPEMFTGRMRTPGYTAPERIGTGRAPPSSGSDDFVLAVVIHQLLMSGLHPFAGHPGDGSDYLSLDDNLLHHRCRILDRTSVVLPRSAPPVDLLPRRLVELFRAAFGGAERPQAASWATELAAAGAAGQLTVCTTHTRHIHTAERPWCPWCDQMERGGDSYPAALGDTDSAHGMERRP